MKKEVANMQEWVRYFGNHLVTFESVYTVPGRDGAPPSHHLWVVTAFVISIQDRWNFMTAAHVFREIARYKEAGCHFESWSLFDYWGRESKHEEPIPIDFEGMTRYVIEIPSEEYDLSDKKTGYDYAILPVRDLIGQNMHKNGIRPLPKSLWDAPIDADYEEYWLFGFPTEHCTAELINGIYHTHRQLVGAQIDRLEKPPTRMVKTIPCFYGHISTEIYIEQDKKLESIKGMSGGPIFGFKDGRYWLVAMQSCWYHDSRNIIGIGMQEFATGIDNLLTSHLEATDSAQPETTTEEE